MWNEEAEVTRVKEGEAKIENRRYTRESERVRRERREDEAWREGKAGSRREQRRRMKVERK